MIMIAAGIFAGSLLLSTPSPRPAPRAGCASREPRSAPAAPPSSFRVSRRSGQPRPSGMRWDRTKGAVFSGVVGEIHADRNEEGAGPILRFPAKGIERRLTRPAAAVPKPGSLLLRYRTAGPDGGRIDVTRRLTVVKSGAGTGFVETFTLAPERGLREDLEIVRPFAIRPRMKRTGHELRAAALLPLYNGRALPVALRRETSRGEWRLGGSVPGENAPLLALPVAGIEIPGVGTAAACADPTYGSLFELRAINPPASRFAPDPAISGSVRYFYPASKVPMAAGEKETRQFGFWTAPSPARRSAAPPPLEDRIRPSIDAFFRLMLPDIRPGPPWVREIAMAGYDYLSDGGRGWERDVRSLARMLRPAERRRVALCLHGWYDALGTYAVDPASGRIRDSWTAMARTRAVPMSRREMTRRLRLARSLGFRALLYFGDGLLQDSKTPGYRPEWDFIDSTGNRITGWQGPDTWGATYARNPAHPGAARWYSSYLSALLEAFGRDIDGVVWDETFYIRAGHIAASPRPAYAGRAMMALVRRLTRQIEAFDRDKVFLVSDDAGHVGTDAVGYAMAADGTYQDSACHPAAWSFGLFPNWRNALYSCNWSAMTNFHHTRWGVEAFGAPVAVSNGWGDDRGPSDWQPWERDAILRLFRERCRQKRRVRCLSVDPERLLASSPIASAPGDPIPAPAPGERNWALAVNGSRAAASSTDGDGASVRPAGVIDGIRSDDGWMARHGWASRRGQPLPQWVEIDFGQERAVRRFTVITYQKEGTEETAGKWGVTDYEIRVPSRNGSWRAVVRERSHRIMKTRVHRLAVPVLTRRFRVVVTRAAPLDGQARLLQVEAWGNHP